MTAWLYRFQLEGSPSFFLYLWRARFFPPADRAKYIVGLRQKIYLAWTLTCLQIEGG